MQQRNLNYWMTLGDNYGHKNRKRPQLTKQTDKNTLNRLATRLVVERANDDDDGNEVRID